jgi:CubicO group peptidase (beta-lactamase class C family)
MPDRFEAIATILREGVEAHAFPAACIEFGRHDGARWNAAFGGLTFDPYAPVATPDTIFDLASLTKVIATATLAMRAIEANRIGLDDRVNKWLTAWRGDDRREVTIRHLLSHSSGLTAYLPFYRDYTGRPEFERAICELPLEYAPDSRSIYSDLGFILLAFILEDAAAAPAAAPRTFDPSTSFAEQFRRVSSFLTPDPLTFNPPRVWRPHCAPTEIDRWRGRLLAGEVHDENCWALGGAAGHAGLFGTAADLAVLAQTLLNGGEYHGVRVFSDSAVRLFTADAGGWRGLGWQTCQGSGSCGLRLSARAYGHTGFTGTSLWIDWERELYVVLLTNRVHGGRDNTQIQQVRPRFHDAVLAELFPV